MRPYKKFTIIFVSIILFYAGFNFIIWKLWTEDILTDKKYYNGGLDRLGYVINSKHYRKNYDTLPKKHIENIEYDGRPVDMITIGDSFSQGAGGGRDRFYQDWIASIHNMTVLNLQRYNERSPLETAIILYNSGYLDKIKPKYLLIETVERFCAYWYGRALNFSERVSLSKLEEYYKYKTYSGKLPEVSFINTGNFKFILFYFLYKFKDRPLDSMVCVRELSKPFFSVKNSNKILFVFQDVENIPYATEKSIKLMNDNLNRFADMLAKKGIKLYFMPAVDKYNLYSDYIINNPYPRSVFFELLRPLEKKYVFIDTKAILLEYVKKGELDIYYADDTHWSWKASKAIVEVIKFE